MGFFIQILKWKYLVFFCFCKYYRLDHDLVELLWENGQVVLNSQTHRKSAVYDPIDSRQQVHKHDQSTIQVTGSCGNPTTLIHDNDTVSWINCQIDGDGDGGGGGGDDDNNDPFEKEFSSNFLPEIQLPNPIPIPNPNPNKKQLHQQFPNFSSPRKADLGSSNVQKPNNMIIRSEVREYSMRTVGSSHCGSNQVAVDRPDTSRASSCGFGNNGMSAAFVKENGGKKMSSQNEKGERETHEQAITSSSGGSDTSFGRTCTTTNDGSLKRKNRDVEDSECQSKVILVICPIFFLKLINLRIKIYICMN